MATDNIWSRDFLEDFPDIAYEAYRPQRMEDLAGAPRTFFDYWRSNQGQNRYSQAYAGALGAQARAGQSPTLTNVDFLAGYPWMQRWLSLTPEQRGVQNARFAPRATWNIPRF